MVLARIDVADFDPPHQAHAFFRLAGLAVLFHAGDGPPHLLACDAEFLQARHDHGDALVGQGQAVGAAADAVAEPGQDDLLPGVRLQAFRRAGGAGWSPLRRGWPNCVRIKRCNRYPPQR